MTADQWILDLNTTFGCRRKKKVKGIKVKVKQEKQKKKHCDDINTPVSVGILN